MQRRTNLCVLESIVSTTKRRLDRVRNSIDFTDTIRSAKALTSMLLPVVIFVSACSFAPVYHHTATHPHKCTSRSFSPCKWFGVAQSLLQSWHEIGQDMLASQTWISCSSFHEMTHVPGQVKGPWTVFAFDNPQGWMYSVNDGYYDKNINIPLHMHAFGLNTCVAPRRGLLPSREIEQNVCRGWPNSTFVQVPWQPLLLLSEQGIPHKCGRTSQLVVSATVSIEKELLD